MHITVTILISWCFFWPCIMNWLYINYQLDALIKYYLFIKYFSPLHVSSLRCSSSGGNSCIRAAYGTVTLYESSWSPVGTQLEWELTGGGRLLLGVLRHPPTTFMVTPCINNIQHFNYQLTHTTLKNVELLKHFKIRKNVPTCFGLQGNHHQGATVST